jgi:hypothetical protein
MFSSHDRALEDNMDLSSMRNKKWPKASLGISQFAEFSVLLGSVKSGNCKEKNKTV